MSEIQNMSQNEDSSAPKNAEQSLMQNAKTCKTCFEWHKHCHAECCKGYYVTVAHPESLRKGSVLGISAILTPDLKRYYELHDARAAHGMVRIKLNDFRITGPHEVFIIERCKGLTEDLKCKFHGTIEQPKICGTPSMDTYHNIPEGIKLTPNCMYKYKLEVEAYELDDRNMAQHNNN